MPIETITPFDLARIPDVSDPVNFHEDAEYVFEHLAQHVLPKFNANFDWLNAALVGDAASLLGLLQSHISRDQIHRARNLIINGSMAEWQRSAVATPMINGYSSVDRWRGFMNTSGEFTAEHKTLTVAEKALTGQAQAMQLKVTTAQAVLAGSHYASVSQRIQARNLQHLKYGHSDAVALTLSFWVKSNKPGTYCVTLNKEDNTEYNYVNEYSIDAANTYERKSITIAPDAGGTALITNSEGRIDNNSGKGLELVFGLAWGSNYHAAADSWHGSGNWATANQVNWMDTVGNNLEITGVQLEVGDVATEFEHEDIGVTRQRCQQHFKTIGGFHNTSIGTAAVWDATRAYTGITFERMGGRPSCYLIGHVGDASFYCNGVARSLNGMTIQSASETSAEITFDWTGNLPQDAAGWLRLGAGVKIALEWEL